MVAPDNMTDFQEKTIKFIGKSENPAAIEILQRLLEHDDTDFRTLAFNALYLKKKTDLYVLLFKQFLKNKEYWGAPGKLPSDRLARLADATLRNTKGQDRLSAIEVAKQYKLYEILPTVVLYLGSSDKPSSDKQLVGLMRELLLHLAESFYNDILNAPPGERRNFDRKREWFVMQLDALVKRYAVIPIDEVLQSLLIIAKKEFDTMKIVTADHRSVTAKKIAELLREGTHRSYFRLLLSYLEDLESPATMDVIISERSDALFVRKLLEVIGLDPSPELRTALKRFTDVVWFDAENPELPRLVEALEPQAIQLLQSLSLPKERVISLYRFFLERPSVESRRAAAESARWVIGAEINRLLLKCVNDSDSQTAATLFKLLKSRGVSDIDKILPQLIERPDPVIRRAIYEMMPELRAESFASQISQMTPMTAQTMGRYVRLVDSNTYTVIDDDIRSPIPIRRAAACKVAMATGYTQEFLPHIIDIAEHDDEMPVRLAAISALSTALAKNALATLQHLSNDRSTDIRNAVETAVKRWAAAYRATMETKHST